jgi:hypothetical protein
VPDTGSHTGQTTDKENEGCRLGHGLNRHTTDRWTKRVIGSFEKQTGNYTNGLSGQEQPHRSHTFQLNKFAGRVDRYRAYEAEWRYYHDGRVIQEFRRDDEGWTR